MGDRPWRHDLSLPQNGTSSAGVHVLWARRMIADWMARRTAGESVDKVRQAVVALGLEHHLVSAYTSLVAVDKTPLRPLEQGLEKKQVPTHLPKGWSQQHVRARMPGTATPSQLLLLSGALLMLLMVWLRRRWSV